MAVGLGADVTVIDRDLGRLKALDAQYAGRVRTVFSTSDAIERHVVAADLVIGTVLVPGAAAPKLVTREMVAAMRPGAVIVDVAVDQGGCCATTRPTTHATPTFVESGVVHYCVANMPGGVARTSTFALNNATLPYVHRARRQGLAQGARRRPAPQARPQRLPGPRHLRRRSRATWRSTTRLPRPASPKPPEVEDLNMLAE